MGTGAGTVARLQVDHTVPAMNLTPAAPVPWLTTAEAAAFLNVHPASVLRWAKAGELPHRKVGSQYRFVLAELEDWQGTGGSRPVKPAEPEAWQVELAGLDPYAAAS